MTYIISFDCGTVNFAYTYIMINDKNLKQKDILFNSDNYNILNINNINFKQYNNLELSIVEHLSTLIECADFNNLFEILIEYQWNINHKTNIVSNVIKTFFLTYFHIKKLSHNCKITMIKPSYKNALSAHVDTDNILRKKYIKNHTFNKKIVEKYFLELNDKYNFIILPEKNKLDDIADSFIQILVYFNYYLD